MRIETKLVCIVPFHHDLLQRQVLVLRHVEVLDAVVLEVPLLLVQYVLEEVDGDVV